MDCHDFENLVGAKDPYMHSDLSHLMRVGSKHQFINPLYLEFLMPPLLNVHILFFT